MLSKKYIKYKPEINRDIFDKIWNKLIASGWECADAERDECYRDFCSNYPYIVDNSEYTPKKFIAYDCTSDNFMKDHKEISYKDFLNDTELSAYSSQDLIARAKREYPIGTKIRSIASGDTFIITTDKFIIDASGDVMGDSDRSRTPVIYSKKQNKWSEIIQKATQEDPLITKARKDYPSGTEIISANSGIKYTLDGTEYYKNGKGDIQVRCSNGKSPVLYDKDTNTWSKIVEVDLLAEARLKYTAGVVCKSAFSGDKFTIRQDDELTLQKSGDISNRDGYIIYNATKSNWAEIISTPSTPSPIPYKFKTGDKVRVTEMHSSNTSRSVGYIGKLTKVDDSKVPYEVDGIWCKNVELFEENGIPTPSTPKFKIGDKVRVTKEKPNSGNTAKVGYVGKLTHKDSSNVPYAVDGSWCVDVELFEESPLSKSKEWWETLKNGDFVVSLLSYSGMRTKDFVYKIQDQTTGHKSIRYIRNNGEQGGTDEVNNFRLATSEEAALYKQVGKACSIIPPAKNLPTDQELLDYANKHFILGTKFISNIKPDKNLERTCEYYYPSTQTSFNWRISDVDGVRVVYCRNGMSNNKGGCSNPYIYTDELGWNKITYDASIYGENVTTTSITTKPERTCVEVTTQAEWDKVLSVVRNSSGYYNAFNEYSSIRIGCIALSDGCHSPKSYFLKEGYIILTFKEWQSRYLKTPSVPELTSLRSEVISPRPNTLRDFNIGDKVIYNGEETVIVALCYSNNYYIVKYNDGWSGSNNNLTINEGKLDPRLRYHYACPEDVSVIGRKSAMIAPEPIDDLKFISESLDMPIKRRPRASKKQTELKFTNN